MSETPKPGFDKAEITANTLSIAPENRSHPVVREFVEFINRVEQLQEDFDGAAHVALARSEAPTPGSESRPMPHEMDVIPSLRDRYSSAELMMRALDFILRDGFAGDTFIQDDERKQKYVASRLNSALGRYGLEVVKKVEPAPVEGNPANPRSRFKVVK
jgi:hypothetical protein